MSITFLRNLAAVALIVFAISTPTFAQDIILLNKDGEKVGVAKESDDQETPAAEAKGKPPAQPGTTSATMANGVITIVKADGTKEEIKLSDARSVTITRSSQMVDDNGQRKMKSVGKAILIGPDGVRREVTLGDNQGGDPVRTVQTPKTWMIGLSCKPVSSLVRSQLKLGENTGLAVTQVLKGGAAETAGVEINDILLFVDQSTLSTNRQLTDAVNETGRNEQTLSLTLLRGGEEMSVTVKPTERERVQQMMLEMGPEGFGDLGALRGLRVPGLPDFGVEFKRLGPGLILDLEKGGAPRWRDVPALPRPEGMKEMREQIEKMQEEMRAEMELLRERMRQDEK